MRKIININEDWIFTKEEIKENVDLPHTWNAVDGQSGADYYRGKCSYEKILPPLKGTSYLEINGANSIAEVFLNGVKIGEHLGGYSAFTTYLTPHLKEGENRLLITVDNSDDERVYPSTADFTFYGGLYRDVNIVTDLKNTHFDMNKGRNGVFATPVVNGDGSATLKVKAYVENATKETLITYTLCDMESNAVATLSVPATDEEREIIIAAPILWNGLENPYLYTLTCVLSENCESLDEVNLRIGFRTITFDADKGCYLNGKHIKLKGVSRHQDRLGLGNALTLKEHKEDIDLILEVGANSVRLAHYQQDQKFYDLCDEKGLLVWAEVPVISRFSSRKQNNAKSQLTELITQCYNHPSIFCWGVENEITIGGKARGVEPAIKELNALAHSLDSTRPTTSAQVMMCSPSSSLNKITDILGYNLYYGWYVERYDSLGDWLDNFHKINPNVKLCLSEYGAEAVLRYQTDKGIQGDYTESYQAIMHNHYAKTISARDWMWGSYVWNMFDFGAANRNEAGVKGRNNKGLVTFDHKTRKDSFYVYKAHWSDEPFVHILGQRYVNRPIGTTSISVATNLPDVTLTVNDNAYHSQCDKLVTFENIEVKEGENVVSVVSGAYKDEFTFMGVEKADETYSMPEGSASFVKNWFCSEGGSSSDYFSINDRVGALLKSPEMESIINSFLGGKKGIAKLLVLLAPFRVKTLLKIARIEPQMQTIAANYLQTIKKA